MVFETSLQSAPRFKDFTYCVVVEHGFKFYTQSSRKETDIKFLSVGFIEIRELEGHDRALG